MSRNILPEDNNNWRRLLDHIGSRFSRTRRQTRPVRVGSVIIGGGFPVSVQSMTNTDTRDIRATIKQIKRLEEAGCEIIRVAVLNDRAADCLAAVKAKCEIPLVADIHFSHTLALKAIEAGVDKVRINPGNIGADWKVAEIVRAASDAEIPIRIGVNSGSLPQDLENEFGRDNPKTFVAAALREIELLDKHGFKNIIISIKTTSITVSLAAHEMLATLVDYPFHLGITEAGTEFSGSVKSAIGIGSLLAQGIGDTIRVSLTADPVEEIKVGRQILKSLELKKEGIEVISCPTCGRCQLDIIGIAQNIEKKTAHIKKHLKVAVMGCVVNGPGEARSADIGIAGGSGFGMLFAQGEILGKVPEDDLENAILREIERLTGEKI